MQKWEYTEVHTRSNFPPDEREISHINGVPQKAGFLFDQKFINDLGRHGWELLAKDANYYIFKRPKE